MIIAVIVLLGLASILLVLLLNRRYLGISYSHQKQSLLNLDVKHVSSEALRSDKNFFYHIGNAVSFIFSKESLAKLEHDQVYLKRDKRELYVSIGQSLFAFITLLLLNSFTQQPLFLFMAIFIPAAIMLEIPLSIKQYKANVDKAVIHIVECLKVLIINTETPLSTALEIIAKGLPQFLPEIKEELLRLLQKAEKTGMRETLMEWKTDSVNFKDFVALLISINEGASKSALKLTIDNFINKSKQEEEENIKNNSENLQLYLMGPVILMFLVILSPMFMAIQYVMSSSGLSF